MKKVIVFVVILSLAAVPALAELDLSELSFDELRQLQTRISIEISSRPEWNSVAVPPGFYEIGVDIPAGEWTITCGESMFSYVHLECGSKANETHTGIKMPWSFGEMVSQPGKGEGKEQESLTVYLPEGYFLKIEYGQAIFSTPERVNLGF